MLATQELQPSNQLPFARRRDIQTSILPLLACGLMLAASVLTWLKDPLGTHYTAWELPIDLGWQFHTGILNYGLLCLCCAVYVFLVVYARWKPFRGSGYFLHRQRMAAALCLLPVLLFLLQYLFIDLAALNLLAQHSIQLLLIQQHFGYTVAQPHFPLSPFNINDATVTGRLVIIANQVSVGPLLPCASAVLLLLSRQLPQERTAVTTAPAPRGYRVAVWALGLLLLAVLLGRGPAAIACQFEAKAALSVGDYTAALHWLDAAGFLNPALNHVPYYHIERGQALYFLQPSQQSEDTNAYLAATYRAQGDYRSAYQQLLAAWAVQHSAWLIPEMSSTLERLSEFIQPLQGPPILRPDNDDSALPWVQRLTLVDPTNVYSHYVLGRIQYDLHNYGESMTEMMMVVRISTNLDVQSSAYTYMALSDAGAGNDAQERVLLFKAVKLDPQYNNNTAREELSGLH